MYLPKSRWREVWVTTERCVSTASPGTEATVVGANDELHQRCVNPDHQEWWSNRNAVVIGTKTGARLKLSQQGGEVKQARSTTRQIVQYEA